MKNQWSVLLPSISSLALASFHLHASLLCTNSFLKPPFLSLSQEKEIYFDGWELKKSILNTLFQAVKAITGGVTAIKGQLIKGSGYALSHGGKVCPKAALIVNQIISAVCVSLQSFSFRVENRNLLLKRDIQKSIEFLFESKITVQIQSKSVNNGPCNSITACQVQITSRANNK